MFAVLVSSGLVIGCANPEMPSGGPRDSSPPVVLEYSPADKTIGFEGEEVIIEFDDYMDRQSVIQNLYITPDVKTEYDWDGKELEITFIEDLKENTTYALTLDAGYSDRFGNNPESAFTIIFSTGQDLDSASISGTVEGSSETLYAAMWMQDSLGEFPNITETPSDYRLKISKSKSFSFKGLKQGNYRIIALDDKFQDGKVDLGSDGFSAYREDIYVEEGERVTGIELFSGPPIDTTAPALVSAYYRNPNAFSIRLSEPVFEESMLSNELKVVDSLGSELRVYSVLKDSVEADLIVAITETMAEDMIYEAFVSEGEAFLKDSSENSAWPYNDTVSFGTPADFDEEDLPRLNLTEINIKDSITGFDYRDSLILQFNYPLEESSLERGVSIVRLGKVKSSKPTIGVMEGEAVPDTIPRPIPFRVEEIAPAKYALVTELEERTEYQLSIDSTVLKIPGVDKHWFADSVATMSYNFSTGFRPDFSTVSGEIRINVDCQGELILRAYREDELQFELWPEESGEFGPLQLEPGNYSFMAFCDENGNGIRDYGYPNPFRFAETEYVVDEKLSVKPKWDIEDFIINIGKPIKVDKEEDNELPSEPKQKIELEKE